MAQRAMINMIDWRLVEISHLLSKLLRHSGPNLGLQFEGIYTSIENLLELPCMKNLNATIEDLKNIVDGGGGNTKLRFHIKGNMIGSLRGHSFSISNDSFREITDNLPPYLMHGTTTNVLNSIWNTGL